MSTIRQKIHIENIILVMGVKESCKVEEAMLHFLTSQIMQINMKNVSSNVYDVTQLSLSLVGRHSELKIINIDKIRTFNILKMW